MANLALKAVMWGAEKIPDHVFERVAPGIYKPPDGRDRNGRSSRGHERPRSRQWYGDESDYDDNRDNRHHHHHHRSSRSAGYRSDKHGRRHRSHSRRRSYDDGEEERYDTDLSDGTRRQDESYGGRNRSYDDDDRYGYTNGYDGRRSHDENDIAADARPPYPLSNSGPQGNKHNAFLPSAAAVTAGAGAGAGAGAATVPRAHHGSTQGPTADSYSSSSSNAVAGAGYVPYADIYNAPTAVSGRPADSGYGSERHEPESSAASPIARPPHFQSQYAQDTLPGSQPSYIQPSDDSDSRYGDYYYDPPARTDRHDRYGSRPRSYRGDSQSPSRYGRAYSPSMVSYNSRYNDDGSRRRARSERRSEKKSGRSKSKSRIREAFDPSQRSLGYSAVGALAGGLVGSEIGKGPLPAVIGALIGGAGTNAFQAREKRRNERRRSQYGRGSVDDRYNVRTIKSGSSGYYSD